MAHFVNGQFSAWRKNLVLPWHSAVRLTGFLSHEHRTTWIINTEKINPDWTKSCRAPILESGSFDARSANHSCAYIESFKNTGCIEIDLSCLWQFAKRLHTKPGALRSHREIPFSCFERPKVAFSILFCVCGGVWRHTTERGISHARLPPMPTCERGHFHFTHKRTAQQSPRADDFLLLRVLEVGSWHCDTFQPLEFGEKTAARRSDAALVSRDVRNAAHLRRPWENSNNSYKRLVGRWRSFLPARCGIALRLKWRRVGGSWMAKITGWI